VTVTLVDNNTAKITFTAASNVSNMYLFGDGGSVGLNTNGAATLTAGSITGITQPQASPTNNPLTSCNGGSCFTQTTGNEDGFGSFNFVLDNFDGFQYAFSTITFTIDRNSGTWASEADVLTANNHGALAAAHIFVANADGTNTNSTGYASNSGTSVPDGGMTMSLLGLALGGLGFIQRRRQ